MAVERVTYNLAELFESVVDHVPEREALFTPSRALTYAELDDRADRLAHHLRARGVGAGDHIGLHLMNGTEYVEAMLAAFKLSAVPINVNYRYVARELEYLYDNADLVALVYDRRFGAEVAVARETRDALTTLLVVDDGSDVPVPDGVDEYEQSLARARSGRDWSGRSDDDLYIAYTGGTTGMPKGVMWRHEDVFFAALGGGDPMMDKGPISSPDELPGRITDFPLVQMYAPPLMHVSAHWGVFNGLFGGSKVVIGSPGFDPAEIWDLISTHGVISITLVGDAMVRPVLDHLAAHPDIDTSSLFVIASGGAILSPSTKSQVNELLPNVIVLDTFGSTETGFAGSRSGADAATFTMDERTTVLDDDHRPVEPGSGTIGYLARRGHVPLGYYKDPTKSAATFVELDGQRWVLPGDFASIEADGTVTLHGRGSLCINTGGEKVFPEEVESVLKGHPSVLDVLVVGVPDDTWGRRVCAVVELRDDRALDVDALGQHARAALAGYKVPRDFVEVERIQRSPNGKPDYTWAGSVAEHAVR